MSLTVSSLTQTVSSSAVPTFAPIIWDQHITRAYCSYPVSGSYGLLPRILFYATLLFATLVHGHLWLVAGALVAALSYSGTAAFHAVLLIWRGPAEGAQDIDALVAILSTACLISVPLLNWSSTLRKLGASARELKEINSNYDAKSAEYEEEARDASEFGTRTIVIYWAILVTVGFVSVWVTENWSTSRTFFPIQVDIANVTCKPGTNTTDISILDPDFVAANMCDFPCAFVPKSELFRPNTDLVLMTSPQVTRFFGVTGYHSDDQTQAEKRITSVVGYYFWLSKWVIPYVLLQGAHTVCFGRRSPRQVRDLIWMGLTQNSPKNWPRVRTTQRAFAGFFAGFVYLGAWFVAILCAPGVLLNISVNELGLNAVDVDAEKPYMVGQWGPWCSTCLVLLAALIGKYHGRVIDAIFSGLRRLFTSKKHCQLEADAADTRHHPASSDAEKGHVTQIITAQQPGAKLPSYFARRLHVINRHSSEGYIQFVNEWKNFGAWCRNPDQVSIATSRHPKQRLIGRGVDPANPEPSKPLPSSATPSIAACHHGPDEQCTGCASVRPVPAHEHVAQHDYNEARPATADVRPATANVSPVTPTADDPKSTGQKSIGPQQRSPAGERAQPPSSLLLPQEIEARSVQPFHDNPDYSV